MSKNSITLIESLAIGGKAEHKYAKQLKERRFVGDGTGLDGMRAFDKIKSSSFANKLLPRKPAGDELKNIYTLSVRLSKLDV